MYFLGLDLGQLVDYTALAIIQDIESDTGKTETLPMGKMDFVPKTRPILTRHYECRHVQRFKLGTTYPDIVTEVMRIVETPVIAKDGYIVCLDATGVGRPVSDLFWKASCNSVAITITGSGVVSGGIGLGGGNVGYHVPKRDLITNLQVLLQNQKLKFADGLSEVPVLIRELLSFQVKITAKAHDTYGNWREGTHDDLVLALALCCWFANRYYPAY